MARAAHFRQSRQGLAFGDICVASAAPPRNYRQVNPALAALGTGIEGPMAGGGRLRPMTRPVTEDGHKLECLSWEKAERKNTNADRKKSARRLLPSPFTRRRRASNVARPGLRQARPRPLQFTV